MTDNQKHTVYINGEKCEVTGVIGVIEYDDKEVILKLAQSVFTLNGDGLELENLSVEDQTATIKGTITAMRYKKSAPKLSLIKRLTK